MLRSSASLRSRQGVETEGEAGQGAALRGSGHRAAPRRLFRSLLPLGSRTLPLLLSRPSPSLCVLGPWVLQSGQFATTPSGRRPGMPGSR